MNAINSDLVTVIRGLDCPEGASALASDDQRRQQVVDALATLDGEAFIGLAELINDKATVARRNKARADFLIAELAMLGWASVIDTLQQRLRDREDAA